MEIIKNGIIARTASGKKVRFQKKYYGLLIESEQKNNRWVEKKYQVFKVGEGKEQFGWVLISSHPKFGNEFMGCSTHGLVFIGEPFDWAVRAQ